MKKLILLLIGAAVFGCSQQSPYTITEINNQRVLGIERTPGLEIAVLTRQTGDIVVYSDGSWDGLPPLLNDPTPEPGASPGNMLSIQQSHDRDIIIVNPGQPLEPRFSGVPRVMVFTGLIKNPCIPDENQAGCSGTFDDKLVDDLVLAANTLTVGEVAEIIASASKKYYCAEHCKEYDSQIKCDHASECSKSECVSERPSDCPEFSSDY